MWSKGRPPRRASVLLFLIPLPFPEAAWSASRLIPALSDAISTGSRISRNTLAHTFSSSGRVSTFTPPPGIGISTSMRSLSRSRARLAAINAPRGSTTAPIDLASFDSHTASARSRSSPPKCASPPVAKTSTVPPPTSRTLTSKVPPPRSNTKTVSSSSTSTPYASAAATGSCSSLTFSRPAARPASIVAAHCASSKYAGTVTTARLMLPLGTSVPSSAIRSIVAIMCCETSIGVTSRPAAGDRRATPTPSGAATTS
mmetsp:Transcript_6593/g.17862  ORF Transcript_6593/g.17862 Transcript_6593/m.17862 type:complete len:257 (+) Transcript_6593:604-1374(+)